MMTDIQVFEEIKKINEYQSEYWSARELAKVLEYREYRNFEPVIRKAQIACKNSGQSAKNHFVDVHDMIEIGKTATREVEDMLLSRYACYLIVQNADPTKEIVALGQTYFAIQTRKQEVQEQLVEDEKRVMLRGEVSTRNKDLAVTARRAGVIDYANFTNAGYMGLYGGLTVKQIHQRKRLNEKQKILDHMGSEELAANLFRATQTEAKIRREFVQGQSKASQTHFEVGKKVRQTIKELGGTVPEQLPAPDPVKAAAKRLKRATKKQAVIGH